MNELQKELGELLEKRDKIRANQLARYDSGSATRKRTTTSNAEADRCNDRIIFLRSEILLAKQKQQLEQNND